MRNEIGQAKPLILSLIVSFLVAIVRFSPGIPQGVDSTSHLSKILFMFNWYNKLGYVPSWYPDWYGGTPFLLLYSPLSYLLTFTVALLGIGVVSAYRIIDAGFFVLAPLTVYLLGRDLDLNVKESAWSSLLFALTPTVIGNYLFYDRFPNVLAIPLACLFLMSFFRMLKGRDTVHATAASVILLASLILIHHLSALLIFAAAMLAFISFAGASQGSKRQLPLFMIVTVGAVVLSGPWLFNFLQATRQFAENPFFNRTMRFPFMKLTYALNDYIVVEQGIVQFLLAMIAIGLYLSTKPHGKKRFAFTVALLLVGMSIFEVGLSTGEPRIQLAGQTLVVAVMVLLIAWILYTARRIKSSPAALFLSLWFTSFLWLGLGYYAMPLADLPFFWGLWRSLDVHRFWLYLSVPAAILAGKIAVAARSSRGRLPTLCLVALLILAISGAAVKAGYSLTQDVNPHLPYTTQNSEIPSALIAYFGSQQEFGRILPIRCPMWIYVLPSYTGKPLIDGWYPQEKLLPYLLEEINDYRINDLETTPNRTDKWEELIRRNQTFGIRWVVIGNANRTLITRMSDLTFKQDIFIEYEKGNLTILKNTLQNPPVQADVPDCEGIIYQRPAPDMIVIQVQRALPGEELTVREAYHSGWVAKINGIETETKADPDGFMQVKVRSAPCSVIIRHAAPQNIEYIFVSASLLAALILISAWPALLAKWRRSDGG